MRVIVLGKKYRMALLLLNEDSTLIVFQDSIVEAEPIQPTKQHFKVGQYRVRRIAIGDILK